ncbi:MAG: phosphatidylglycerophosphatase A [Bdellovibrionota bacterium]|nr:MAG: phosphatidylglycerophosphatase A [Bdellovibrionota bacterium]
MHLSLLTLGHLIATGFGAGRAAHAPGSWGSLQAFVVWCGIEFYSGGLTVSLRVTLAIGISLLGVWAAAVSLGNPSRNRAQHAKAHDPGDIVIDEWAGMWWALLPTTIEEPLSIFSALLLFRLFDIIKPWPVRHFEKLPRGWGIVADDVVAGMIAALVISLVLFSS